MRTTDVPTYDAQRDGMSIDSFRHTHVTGGGGAGLHVVDTGIATGRPIVFIHGFSQSWLAWRRQLCSDLASEYRLVAMDLRGHGESDKPHDAYSDRGLWADDINAVVRELELARPILCGWSYGSLVILDYIRQYGEGAISGICFVDALTRLGSDEALSVLTPELLNLVPGLFTTDVTDSVRSLEAFVRMCFVQEPSAEDLYLMLGYNLTVPPRVRQALFTRTFDNDDLLTRIRKPVLVVHGTQDALVKPSIVDQHTASMPHAQLCVMNNAGHAPFWDDAASFNRDLRAFCENVEAADAS